MGNHDPYSDSRAFPCVAQSVGLALGMSSTRTRVPIDVRTGHARLTAGIFRRPQRESTDAERKTKLEEKNQGADPRRVHRRSGQLGQLRTLPWSGC